MEKTNGKGVAVTREVPIIGAGRVIGKGRSGAQMGAIPRKLDEDGMFEVTVVAGPNNEGVPLTKRSDYLDAEQLVEMIRLVVREELERATGLLSDE